MTEQEKEILEEEVTTEEPVEEPAEETTEEVVDAAALQVQLDELNQRFLRTAADFENYKRRTALEKEDLMKYSNAKIIGEIERKRYFVC